MLLALLVLAASLDAQPLHVGKIVVEPLDVYSASEKQRGTFYRLADRFHIETRRHVIEKFLLFREGDVYEPARLAETERNLRSLGFLKSASVTASAPHDGLVDIRVVTQDSWSIAPETQAGSRGGMNTYGATISETNLVGLGKDIELGWNKGVDRRQTALNYNDPAFFAPYLRAHFGYAHTSDGYNRQFNLRRPFFAFSTPWASDASFAAFRQNNRLYRDGIEVSRFQQNHREFAASYGIALRPNDAHASRVTLGFRSIDDDFTSISGHERFEHMREFRYLLARYEYAENDFLKMNFVNKDLRFEDFNLGRRFSVEGAVSPTALGVDSTTEFVHVRAGSGLRLGEDAFVMPSFGVSTRLASGIQNMIGSANVLYVNRQGGDAYPLTTVGHVSVSSGWRMDPELQFFADGLGGLRGYRAHTFAGSRSIVINLEERLYLGREMLQLASPGVVAFIDAGNATDGGFASLMRMQSDVGVGIRVGLPRTPKNLLRIDFAYALNRDPRGHRGLLVSFSSGQAF
ncbi:MAG: BamA/TamA family outer membrane protein [Acidobacteriota bacterium]|nr:BamA/TamA family outer membrane protein [Acidobacteriota bacterium]